MATFKYFNGTEELFNVTSMDNKKVVTLFGALIGKKYDSFSRWVGFVAGAGTTNSERAHGIGAKPVTRIIEFKSRPSLHKCDARCRNAKGNCCECSCGGKHHGAGG